MKKGDYINTPRFCTVKIEEVFANNADALAQGFHEPTHYRNDEYEILGKHTGLNRMIFAAAKK